MNDTVLLAWYEIRIVAKNDDNFILFVAALAAGVAIVACVASLCVYATRPSR